MLQTVEVLHGSGQPHHSVIWLHGLGASGHDFEPIVPELGLPGDKTVQFVFPHAPNQPVTINGGMVMPAWYDIKGASLKDKQDDAGIRRSAELVEALLHREHERGVPYENMVLAGFSQGGAMSLHLGLRFPHRLAGVMALSCYLPLAESLPDERSETNQETPIFMAHGSHDPMVPMQLGEMSRDRLTSLDYAVQWHDYPMPHAVCPQEIADIGHWLNQVLA